MLKNKRLKELAGEYINKYGLNLDGYNVLVPTLESEPVLLGLIAAMAGANNVYMFDPKANINKNYESTSEEYNFNGKFIGSLSGEILSGTNIILKNSQISLNSDKLGLFAKQKAVVCNFPDNLDFLNTQGMEMEDFRQKNTSLVAINPEDPKIGLYQYYAHSIIKRCYESGLDVFKSKILLAGNGGFLSTTLSMLKTLGAVVYTYNTNSTSDQSYVLKHLKDIDAIIVMDYPLTKKQVIGSKGVISICDIVDQCPLVKILHFSGKIETGSLKLGNINFTPENLSQDTISLNIKDLGERGLVEMAVANLKIAEHFLINPMNQKDSVVAYNVLSSKLYGKAESTKPSLI